MDLLANYDDDNTQENSVSRSPSPSKKVESSEQNNMLENEWLSFEQMISQTAECSKPVVQNDFLVGGVVAYPGMSSSQTKPASPKLEKRLSNSSVKDDNPEDISCDPTDDAEMPALEEDDDAFFKLRKQVKELDRSSSSSSGSSSASSSRSGSPEKEGSPSPPHLSPQISLPTTTASAPPDITETATTSAATEKTEEKASEKQKDHKTHQQSKSRERRDRKRSHRSKHHRSSKSRRHRSGSRSRDRRKRHDRHRRHRSKDRRSSKDETKENKDRRDSAKTEESNRKNSTSERKHSESKTVDSQSDKRHSRSKSRDRDRRKDKKEGRSRHRSGEKKRRSHSRDRKRSQSRDRKRKHRSHSRHRSRSPHRNKGRHSRSRSRERLRSRSPIGVRKLTFKEQMRKQFIDASKEMAKEKVDDSSTGPVRRPGQCLKPSDLLRGVKLNSGESVTPQMALMQTMAAMHKQAQELTGVEVPKYYNPAAVNPLKYAEQIKKRKLLWAKKDEVKEKNDQIETQWKSAFIEEDDGKTASKFRKLMGIKGQAAEGGEELTEDIQKLSEEQRRKHQELFDRLDQEYSFARMTTHTQRGVGLGFSSAIIDPNHPSVKPP
ncbi:arginine/serine-rich coiled-coil protein 2-like [Mya arenaria]|uniref:arginine/serine-rich coiled-coil protein 2-like n=1 Tax=Mya arenaria TaxID=6604 RepID=UPI0022E7CFE4|nr:arginine/serine-rich coiled-coil protein 2-like [Mya arenaria]